MVIIFLFCFHFASLLLLLFFIAYCYGKLAAGICKASLACNEAYCSTLGGASIKGITATKTVSFIPLCSCLSIINHQLQLIKVTATMNRLDHIIPWSLCRFAASYKPGREIKYIYIFNWSSINWTTLLLCSFVFLSWSDFQTCVSLILNLINIFNQWINLYSEFEVPGVSVVWLWPTF